MAWQRNIPFGYTMKKGEIQCCPTESAVVKDIFKLYLEGMAYSKIADSMMLRGIRYHKHTEKWNKHMVKRILENKRYFGEKEYPQIIKLETFMGVQLIKEEKNTCAPCPEYIKPIREKAVCGVCGGRMLRDTKSAGKPRWYCENEGCTNRRYIEDEDARETLYTGLDSLAQTPCLLDWPIPRNTGELTLEVVRIQNEVVREMNKTEAGIEYTKMLILACAAEKYSGLPDYMPYYQMQRLKEKISGQPIDEELRNEIFRIAVQKIHFTDDSGFRLQLINGQTHETGGKENAKCLQTQ